MQLSRRQFLAGLTSAGLAGLGSVGLAGAGVAGLAVAGAGLQACTPDDDQGANPADEAGPRFIPAAYLNPQDYDYRQNTTDFKTLFSPLRIGSIELSHRMVKAAAGSACHLAGLTDELLEYYLNFARGGVELIWLESIPELEPAFGSGEASSEAFAFGQRLVEECALYGASLGYQWAAYPLTPVPQMTPEQISQTQAHGVAIARSMQAMGFKALEINAAGEQMGAHFFSRYHNSRTDTYGAGSLEDRARFVTECISQIKQACGDSFLVQLLMDCLTEVDDLVGGATPLTPDNRVTVAQNRATTSAEGIGLARLCAAAGCDALHLRLGPLGNRAAQLASDLYFIVGGVEGATGYGTQWDFSRHWQGQLSASHSGAGLLLGVAAHYHDALDIPVGAVAYMDPAHAPVLFEQALADGQLDFYLMNRPLTVDTDYVKQLREGRLDEIAPCTRCLHCHVGSNADNAREAYCRVNALTQRVMRQPLISQGGPATYELPPLSGEPKRVMVVGGGPGGMEAARIAALRGHQVTLYERRAELGGLLGFASLVKGPHQNLTDFKAYLTRQLALAGVKVVLNRNVDAAFITAEAPDAVILAVGGLPNHQPVGGNDSVQVVDFDTFLTAQVGDDVVVWGSGARAFDCALWYTVRRKRVNIVTPDPAELLDRQQSQHAMRQMTTALYALGVKAYPGATIQSVGNAAITILTDAGTELSLPCDAIVNASDLLPNTALQDAIQVSQVFAVGDCAQPFNIARAIQSGHDAGRNV